MNVERIWTGKTAQINVEEQRYTSSKLFSHRNHFDRFCEAMSLNTTGTPDTGSATDKGLLQMAEKMGVDY